MRVLHQLELPAVLDGLPRLVEATGMFCKAAGIGVGPQGRIELVLEEVFVNICNYAYRDGKGNASFTFGVDDSGQVRIEVRDSGTPFDLRAAESPDTTLDVQDRPIGGLGIHLVRTLVKALNYRQEGGRNCLELVFSPGEGSQAR
jgi:serine/threonine-protein kinase RsbW